MQPLPKLLGLAGSLRKESYNTAVLRTLKEQLRDKAELEIFALKDIPLYNQDLDGELPPPAVGMLKDAVKVADGVIICSPEYNYSISGVLKNALDWASRPGYQSVFKDKPVLVMTVSPAMTGGVRAQAHLRDVLASMLVRLVAAPEIVIGSAHQKISDGRLQDAATLSFVLDGLELLLAELRPVGGELPARKSLSRQTDASCEPRSSSSHS